MLRAVLSLVRSDIEQQARWAACEAGRRDRRCPARRRGPVLIATALLRPERSAVPRPLVQATDPHVLKGALAQDMSVAGDQALALAKGSRIGPAMIAGEEAFKTGSTIYRAARAQLSGHSTSTVVGSLAVAIVFGLVLGRRIRTTYPRPSS